MWHMTRNVLFEKLKRRVDYPYLILFAFSGAAILFLYLVGFDPKTPAWEEASPISFYTLGLIFAISPIAMIWSIFRIVHLAGSKSHKITKQRFMLSDLGDTPNLDQHIEDMESKAVAAIYYSAKESRKFEGLAQITIFLAVTIPIITWVFTLFHVFSAEKTTNIGTLVLSSASFGAIATTISITMLRHSKAHISEENKSNFYLESLRRLRISLKVDTPQVNKDVLELLSKYASSQIKDEDKETRARSEEDRNNILNLLASVLPKT
jgi:hypothetical protein